MSNADHVINYLQAAFKVRLSDSDILKLIPMNKSEQDFEKLTHYLFITI